MLKTIFLNILKVLIKKIKNKRLMFKIKRQPKYGFIESEQYKKYKNAKKHDEWKHEVQEFCLSKIKPNNLKNFKHYLIKEEREKEIKAEFLGSIYIPLCIFIFTMGITVLFIANDKLVNMQSVIAEKQAHVKGNNFVESNASSINKEYNEKIDLYFNGVKYACIVCIVVMVGSLCFLVICDLRYSEYKRKKYFFYDYIEIIDLLVENESKKLNKKE